MLEKLNAQPMPIKLVIALVLAAVVGGGSYYFMVMPVQEKNKQEQAALDKKVAENNNLKQYESKLADLDRQIVQLKAQIANQKLIVPDDKDTDKFIVLLQETASNAGIQLRKLESKTVSNKDYYAELPFAIEVDGPFYGVLNFFDKLSGQTRIVNVENLTMKANGKGQAKYPLAPTDSVNVTAIAKTFYSREAPPASAAAATKK
jgi:type IV pilus assembly protein PilO